MQTKSPGSFCGGGLKSILVKCTGNDPIWFGIVLTYK